MANRREALMGMAAAPTLAGLPQWRWQHGETSVLLHDPALAAGRRFADAGMARGGTLVAIIGERVRLAQQVLASRPALLAGVSLSADALLFEDVAREYGYARVALLAGGATCTMQECQAGWRALGTFAEGAGAHWIEALADYAVAPGGSGLSAGVAQAGEAGSAPVFGWVLARG